ncbi:MAG TPA: FGGY family carbohydrate kinase [Elusimicrobiales bacterium]|nr:FGGY family carbohydrate kinase [Elusimicrobiales bacterium]
MTIKTFITLDLGTSSVKCSLIDSCGKILNIIQKPLTIRLPKTGWVEYDAKQLLNTPLELLDETIKSAPKDLQISGIGVASQRSTIVLWDKKSGEPLCPVLSWQDGRAAAELSKVSFSQEEIHKITGLYKTPYYSASKISWCLKNYEEVKSAYQKGDLLCGALPTYLIWKLTEGKTFAIDATLAQRMLLFDIKKLCWDKKLLDAFGIDENILPEITPSVKEFGTYKGIAILAMIGDQQAALVGVGAISEGLAALNYGTGAFLLANTGTKLLDVQGLLSSVNAQIAKEKITYSLEGTVNSAGSMFDWLKLLGFDLDIKKIDDYCNNSQTNPMVLPALGGLGAPFWDFNTSVTFTGLTPQTKKEDIAKASLQGIAFLVAIIAMSMKKSNVNLKEIRASGGLAESKYLLSFQSDLLHTPVIKMYQEQTTLLGAAYLMSKYLGLESDKWNFLEKSEKFVPKLSASQSEKLLSCYMRFLELSRQISRI